MVSGQRRNDGRVRVAAIHRHVLRCPLASLDQRLKEQILPFLKRIKEETRIPMIFVTHAQAEVDYLADQVIPMTPGRLGADPAPQG